MYVAVNKISFNAKNLEKDNFRMFARNCSLIGTIGGGVKPPEATPLI